MTFSMYIYALRDKKTGMVGYVGASREPQRRYTAHMYDKTSERADWIASLDEPPELVVLEEVEAYDDRINTLWPDREQYWIRHFQDEGHWLINRAVSAPDSEWRCKECGSYNIPHQGRGLCRNCYMREYRKNTGVRRSQQDYQEGYQEGYKQSYKHGYQEGYTDGQSDITQAINAALDPYGGACWTRNGSVYLKMGDETVKGKM
jgi:predicted GIY-YIG superfamily endonuclease